MPDQGKKLHVPEGIPGTGQEVHVFDAKARSCPDCHSIGPPQDGCRHPWHQMGIQEPEETLVHQFTLAGGPDWPGGLCELHCREDRCGDKGQRCSCPGHQEDGTHIVQTTDHKGWHGWQEHDGYPLHRHNPIAKSIQWATQEDRQLFAHKLAGKPQEVPRCGRFGCLLPEGHNQGKADIPSNHDARTGRCPDGGHCHGSTIAAGSPPCEPGTCFRVRTSGPITGVFPDDRWPREILIANGVIHPDGTDLRKAIHKASQARQRLQDVLASRDVTEMQELLAAAAAHAQEVIKLAVRANQELTGEETIKFQGQVYTQ